MCLCFCMFLCRFDVFRFCFTFWIPRRLVERGTQLVPHQPPEPPDPDLYGGGFGARWIFTRCGHTYIASLHHILPWHPSSGWCWTHSDHARGILWICSKMNFTKLTSHSRSLVLSCFRRRWTLARDPVSPFAWRLSARYRIISPRLKLSHNALLYYSFNVLYEFVIGLCYMLCLCISCFMCFHRVTYIYVCCFRRPSWWRCQNQMAHPAHPGCPASPSLRGKLPGDPNWGKLLTLGSSKILREMSENQLRSTVLYRHAIWEKLGNVIRSTIARAARQDSGASGRLWWERRAKPWSHGVTDSTPER